MGWVITFVNGETERTPDSIDRLVVDRSAQLLQGWSTRTYGPDELIATWPTCNIIRWAREREPWV